MTSGRSRSAPDDGALGLSSFLVDRMSEGVCAVSRADETIVYASQRLDRLFGYEPGELSGRPLGLLRPADEARTRWLLASEGIAERLDRSGEASAEVRCVRKDGSLVWCRARASRLDHAVLGATWLVLFEDVTDRRRLQAQLHSSDRLASLGSLTAGITHEINNPLAYILSNLDLVGEELAALPDATADGRLLPLRDMVRDAREGAERVRTIVHGLRAFCRSDDDRRGPIDVRAVLASCLGLAQGELRRRARVRTELGEVAPVEADEARLGQVFVSLLSHATQSIAPGNADQHEVTVTTRQAETGEVLVEIAGTGRAIGEKGVERGQGLSSTSASAEDGAPPGSGLAGAQGTLRALGGRLEVEGSPGEGSSLRVWLPPARGAAGSTAARTAADESKPVEGAPRWRGTVLIVDDDAMVARTIRRILGGDHEVTVAANGEEALRLLRAGARFDAVVCDVMMPVMSGIELYDELSRSLPDVCPRIVFITGGPFAPAAKAFLSRVPNRWVDKPFPPQALRSLVQEMVDRAPAAQAPR